MWAAIKNFIAILQGLLSLWRYFQDWQETQAKAEAEKRRQEREKALEDLKNAKTEDEIWDAQDRIARNSK